MTTRGAVAAEVEADLDLQLLPPGGEPVSAHLTGSVRENSDMIEGIVRRTMASMGTREARHWGISR